MTPPRLVAAVLLSVATCATACVLLASCADIEEGYLYDRGCDPGADAGAADAAHPPDAAPTDASTPDGG